MISQGNFTVLIQFIAYLAGRKVAVGCSVLLRNRSKSLSKLLHPQQLVLDVFDFLE
jgi:hypothetical protein